MVLINEGIMNWDQKIYYMQLSFMIVVVQRILMYLVVLLVFIFYMMIEFFYYVYVLNFYKYYVNNFMYYSVYCLFCGMK